MQVPSPVSKKPGEHVHALLPGVEKLFAVHGIHVSAPTIGAAVFGGQDVHTEWSNVLLYVPGTHGTHVALFSSNPTPFTQTRMHCPSLVDAGIVVILSSPQERQLADPAEGLYVCSAHGVQVAEVVARTSVLNVPAGQERQIPAPTALYVPGRQSIQLSDGAPTVALYFPAEQLEHVSLAVAPIAELYVPARQLVQTDIPDVTPYFPAGQERHELTETPPGVSRYVPARQLLHVAIAVAPTAELYVPVGHERHEAAPEALYVPA